MADRTKGFSSSDRILEGGACSDHPQAKCERRHRRVMSNCGLFDCNNDDDSILFCVDVACLKSIYLIIIDFGSCIILPIYLIYNHSNSTIKWTTVEFFWYLCTLV